MGSRDHGNRFRVLIVTRAPSDECSRMMIEGCAALSFSPRAGTLVRVSRIAAFAVVALTTILLARPAEAQPTGRTYHGAGGPFYGAVWVFLPETSQQMVLLTVGGSGYSYRGERLRLGGGGQGTSASSLDDGFRASLSWGGLSLAYDFLGSGRWEFPVGVTLGGGRLSVERVVSAGDPDVVERRAHVLFLARLYVAAELRVTRLLKLALQVSAQMGVHDRIALWAGEATLNAVFLLPRSGY